MSKGEEASEDVQNKKKVMFIALGTLIFLVIGYLMYPKMKPVVAPREGAIPIDRELVGLTNSGSLQTNINSARPVEGLVSFSGTTVSNSIQIIAVNGIMNVISNGVDLTKKPEWPKNTKPKETVTINLGSSTNSIDVQFQIPPLGDTEFILPPNCKVDRYIRVNRGGSFVAISENDYDLSQDGEMIRNGTNSHGHTIRLRNRSSEIIHLGLRCTTMKEDFSFTSE